MSNCPGCQSGYENHERYCMSGPNCLKHGVPARPTVSGKGTRPSEGRKDDSDKIALELIPPEAVQALGEILSFGAKKYGPRNWEKGMRWGRLFGATLRHLYAWWRGEKGDPETGKSHLWHALCCVAFLVAYEMRAIGEDDRR